MDCQHILQDLSPLLDGELEAGPERQARDHLLGCPGCRACLQELEKNRDLLAALPRLPVPECLRGRVMEEVGRAAPRSRPIPRSRFARVGRVLAAAAVLLVSSLVGLTLLGYNSDEPGPFVAGGTLVDPYTLDSGASVTGEPPLSLPGFRTEHAGPPEALLVGNDGRHTVFSDGLQSVNLFQFPGDRPVRLCRASVARLAGHPVWTSQAGATNLAAWSDGRRSYLAVSAMPLRTIEPLVGRLAPAQPRQAPGLAGYLRRGWNRVLGLVGWGG